MTERLDKMERILDKMILENDKRAKEADERAKEADERAKEADRRSNKLDKKINKLERVMNGIWLTQWDISEEIIADNFWNVFKNIWENISTVERNIKVYSNWRIKWEFDIIWANGKKIFIWETKTKLTKDHIDKLINVTIPNFKKYDNRHKWMKVYWVVWARVFANEDVKNYAINNWLYVIKETHKWNTKILKESLKNIKNF